MYLNLCVNYDPNPMFAEICLNLAHCNAYICSLSGKPSANTVLEQTEKMPKHISSLLMLGKDQPHGSNKTTFVGDRRSRTHDHICDVKVIHFVYSSIHHDSVRILLSLSLRVGRFCFEVECQGKAHLGHLRNCY